MSEPVKGPETPRRYESSEVSVKQLFGFAAGVVVLVLLGVLGSVLVFHVFKEHTPMGPPASPFDDARKLPPDVRLQTAAPIDLQHYRDEQDKILNEYRWVDPKAGVVRIPVDRAMELLLQKGYPVRNGSASKGPMNTPGEPSPPGRPLTAPTPQDGEELH